jgi:UDP-glucuronate decarboxylase
MFGPTMDKTLKEDLDEVLSAPLPWDRLSGSTVLVSGGSGLLGHYLVATLLHWNDRCRGKKCKVVCLARSEASVQRRLGMFTGRDDLRVLLQDVTQGIPSEMHVDYVIHAASNASPWKFVDDPVGTLKANTVGTLNLLEHASACSAKKFLFVSSAEVYGQLPADQEEAHEDLCGVLDHLAVRSCYAESKRMGETMCICWGAQYGLPCTVVRPFHTYGPGLVPDDGRVFADFVADVAAGRDIRVKGDGDARRAFCYVADATAAFFTALFLGGAGCVYNVGNPQAECSVKELAELLIRISPTGGLSVLQDISDSKVVVHNPVSRTVPCISRIEALGWRPTTGIENGFRRTIGS